MYYDGETAGHFITIFGYDEATKNIIFSDCAYWGDCGIYATNFETLKSFMVSTGSRNFVYRVQ